ncbi:MAG: adenylate kinase family protein [Candidatus Woesearchaeota archaeon]|nr:adenylate kinase family protein [Candidatus Woesearchaeota archaeon]
MPKSAKFCKKTAKSGRNTAKSHFYIILISGTPGTGKSTLAKFLARTLTFHSIDCRELIEKKHISSHFDRKRECLVVDTDKLNSALENEISRLKALKTGKNRASGAIIDSHLSHFFPKEQADLCIICTCALPILKTRLEKRGYNSKKVRENLDSEIFSVCLEEAREAGHNILTIDTSSRASLKKAALLVKKELF